MPISDFVNTWQCRRLHSPPPFSTPSPYFLYHAFGQLLTWRTHRIRLCGTTHLLQWVRTNPKARQAKSKARLARYESLSQVS